MLTLHSARSPAPHSWGAPSTHETTFSSGANLGGFAADVPLVHKHFEFTGLLPRLFELIAGLPKPTICAANGHVLAGALGIALACDLVIASEAAEFGTPEINVGAFPFMIMALIYRNVPRKRTNELLLLGERISAQEAKQAGIVNRVVPTDELAAATREWAGKLASRSPAIMRLGKEAMFRQQDMPLGDALEYLRAQLALALSTEDVVELKKSEGGAIFIHGSAELARRLSDAGLIDQYNLLVFPVLLGDGKSIFGRADRAKHMLTLREFDTYSNGILKLVYDVKR